MRKVVFAESSVDTPGGAKEVYGRTWPVPRTTYL